MHLCLCLCSRAEGNGTEGICWKSHDACQEHVMVIFQLKIQKYILLKDNEAFFRSFVFLDILHYEIILYRKCINVELF